ncbi:ESX secretion-associated protein EspG [[Mycobacterium] wendilense]|uniref:ESX secretion-associated protein EspG n=1 Tax=[Mycobacterium] wendilense TaxID=3064284 RepID=A0ABM9M7X8_9MYCO|nr:ESX secretion-associated protein EspG [Mycolicibacterium sp. MU0050]CAJ1578406.1 ESX secretion-associated protein EspG [Mycolicibacterium sp. MU0050]
MLTTTVDGLLVLQVISGIEVLAPELGLRPHLPSVETKQAALEHPMAAELREQGVIDEQGVVDAPVLEWLTVIARRDVALLIHAVTPDHDGLPRRVLLARYAQWWVTIERTEHLIRIGPAGMATAEGAASSIVADQIDRLCGTNAPAQLRPVTLEADALVATVRDRDTLRRHLMDLALDADQIRLLMLAGDPSRSAQASIVAVQSGVETGTPTRAVLSTASAAIVDTPEGRVVYETVQRDGKKWFIVSPGSAKVIATAVGQLLRCLPASDDWYSYRKVV